MNNSRLLKTCLLNSLLVLFLLPVSCKSKKQAADHQDNTQIELAGSDREEDKKPLQIKDENVFVKVEKTPCYGECLVYELTVFKDGTVHYTGKNFVEKEGDFTAQLSSSKMEELKARIEKADFFNADETYDDPEVTDLPSTVTSVQMNGKNHTVTARTGVPEKIKQLNQYLNRLVNELELTPVEE